MPLEEALMLTRRTVLAGAATLGLAPAAQAADRYAAALARAWGGPLDPRAAHGLAMREVQRLQARLVVRLQLQGVSPGASTVRLRKAFALERFLYADDDAGRDRAVADMNAALAALRPRLSTAFAGEVPPTEVRRMSSEDEAKGRGGYREPGAYYVDLKAIRERPSWTLATVAFHETVPGHALQSAQLAPAPPPERQRHAGVFSEAWATYAEQLAADLGAYEADPMGEIGQLHWRLFRMARVVVDTGQGALGWSLDEATARLIEMQAHAIAFVTMEADAARMRREPGVFAAQGLGALEIARLRPRRREDWPAFHAAILADGPWPCAMLETKVRKGSV
ncbi:MAG: DUF885 domain-containing protein [Phenylobacterium zucineum]|nr:MAG: DUF885 domain-containing protein [Phenylobacterium zucineum]